MQQAIPSQGKPLITYYQRINVIYNLCYPKKTISEQAHGVFSVRALMLHRELYSTKTSMNQKFNKGMH